MYRIYRFTLYWSSSWTLAVKCDVSVQPDFEQNITKQTANGYFTIATSPTPVQIQSDCVQNLIESESESFLNPPRLGGFESRRNPIRLRSHWWTRRPNLIQVLKCEALCGSSQSSELDIDLRSIRVKSQNLYLDTFLLFLILILINPFCFTLRFVNPLYFFQS